MKKPGWRNLIVLLTALLVSGPGAAAGETRFLLGVETTADSARNIVATRAAVADLLVNGLAGIARPGDTVGLWTVGEKLDTSFPRLIWQPGDARPFALRVDRLLATQAWTGRLVWTNHRPSLNAVAANSDALTVVLVTAPRTRFGGLPFSEKVSAVQDKATADLERTKLPFVTFLTVRGREFTAATVNSGIGPWTIPNPPLPKPASVAAPAPAAPKIEFKPTPAPPPPAPKPEPPVVVVKAPGPKPEPVAPPVPKPAAASAPNAAPVTPAVEPAKAELPKPSVAVVPPPPVVVAKVVEEKPTPVMPPKPEPIPAPKPETIVESAKPASTPASGIGNPASGITRPLPTPTPEPAPQPSPRQTPTPKPVTPTPSTVAVVQPAGGGNGFLLAGIGSLTGIALLGWLAFRRPKAAQRSLITESFRVK